MSAVAVIAAQQLNPVRHGNQIPGLDAEAGVGMDECAGSQNATVMGIATEGWRAARKQWPDNFVGGKMLSRSVALSVSLRVTCITSAIVAAWWAGGCPDEMFIQLMLDGTFDLAMIEGYACRLRVPASIL
eukprot:COSAG04_NODE_6768_length_1260_cov_2.336779_2_plen_130_part_00